MALDPASVPVNQSGWNLLWLALAASVALHAALLFAVPDLWTYPHAGATAPLIAWVEPGPSVKGEPIALGAGVPSEAERVPRQIATKDSASRGPVHDPKPELPTARPSEAASELIRTTATTNRPVSGDPSATVAALVAPVARPGDAELDIGSLAQYRLALIGVARHHKFYPADAIESGWQGRVGVRLVVSAGGALAHADVQSSSGYDLLDEQAVEMIRQAQRLTPIPPALRDRAFTVDFPVSFELNRSR